MKKLSTLLAAVLISINLFAQAPQKMSYQAVIRDAQNELVVNKPVKMRISILQGNAPGNPVYSELHSATTNANGLVSIEIGTGTSQQGTFSNINWGNGTYFLKTETDPTGGNNYSIAGTSQLLSVPYALYAAKSGNSNITPGNKVGDMLYWNGSTWTNIPVGKPGQIFQLNENNIPGWTGDTYPVVQTLPVTEITDISAKFNVKLVSAGLSERPNFAGFTLGVCFDTLPNPKTLYYSSNTLTDSFSVPGNYTFSLSGTPGSQNLLPNKKYYVRAFAENGAGLVYGNEVSFTTSSFSSSNEKTVDFLVNASNTGNFTLFSFADGKGVASADSNSVKWDVGIRLATIIVNNASSGPGSGYVQILDMPFSKVSNAQLTGWEYDTSATQRAVKIQEWASYNTTTRTFSPIAGKTFVFVTATGKYSKLEILKVEPTDDNGNPITPPTRPTKLKYTLRYNYQGNGTPIFSP